MKITNASPVKKTKTEREKIKTPRDLTVAEKNISRIFILSNLKIERGNHDGGTCDSDENVNKIIKKFNKIILELP